MARLITLPVSHYCEKARWALERAGIAYREERHVQGIHQVAARRAGGKKTVPVLVTPGGVLDDSADILRWVDERAPADRRLYPDGLRDDVERLASRFDDRLGPHGRRMAYIHMFDTPDVLFAFNNVGVPRWEDRFLRWGWPVVKRFAVRELDITPGVEQEDERIVWEELDHAASLLADGRPYLCGDRFTAADLTFACLSATVVAPEGYGVPLPAPDAVAPRFAALIRKAREHPAGQHALRMFAERREQLAGAG